MDDDLWAVRNALGRGPDVVRDYRTLHEQGTLVDACDAILARARADDNFIPDRLMITVANALLSNSPGLTPLKADGHLLTPAQERVACLVARGLSNKEIGESLGVTAETATEYVKTLLRRAKARNRTELALWTIGNADLIFTPA